MKINDLKKSGHAPSLFSAFLHFDVSFMVWVILGALMPFIATDPQLTGVNLKVTPSAMIQKAGQYTLIIKGPDAAKHQPSSVYNLIIKPGDPSVATRASVKPVEKYVVNNAVPATIDAVNNTSKLIHIALADGVTTNPNENVIALKPMAALAKAGKAFQPLSNGFPTSVKLLLVGIPLLAAGFWRILLGILVDSFGSRRVGAASMFITMLPLCLGMFAGTSYDSLLLIGFFLGLAGASFAVALPLASRWYPPHLQGLAMGIAGAGNSGTILATVFAPMLAKMFGWHDVFGLLMIPVAITFVSFTLLARDAPGTTGTSRAGEFLSVLRQGDTFAFCLLYFVTFGGFVGLSSFFNTFFVDQYDAPKAAVGLWTWPFIIFGSFLRPVGGALSDRIGGVKMLTILYSTVIVSAVAIGLMIGQFSVVCVLLMVLMGCLGMGNGSVFQLVPQRFKREMGVITGLVGAAGGVGGYYLNFALGHLHDITATYASGFFAFAVIAGAALTVLSIVSRVWKRTWLSTNGKLDEQLKPESAARVSLELGHV
jgi:NNP family nitrate/nitrite transporter-like MFS transporter